MGIITLGQQLAKLNGGKNTTKRIDVSRRRGALRKLMKCVKKSSKQKKERYRTGKER